MSKRRHLTDVWIVKGREDETFAPCSGRWMARIQIGPTWRGGPFAWNLCADPEGMVYVVDVSHRQKEG